MNSDIYTSARYVAELDDINFAEFFVHLGRFLNTEEGDPNPSPDLRRKDMRKFNLDDLMRRLRNILSEVLFSEEICMSAWWKQEPTDAELVEEALDVVDTEDTADEMANLLMDPDWSTYKMFERIAQDYLAGNADVQKGIDQTMENVTGWSMKTIAQRLLDKRKGDSEDET